ncbi:MAG: hypothetical protein IAE78_12310 [Myxococcus sp.]|nr:hypothetical protein [Myxococcus sp.]
MRLLAGLLMLLGATPGPTPKPLTADEAKVLEGLAGAGARVDAAQAFSVTLGPLGRVQLGFACALEATPRCRLVVAKGGEVVQLLDDPLATKSPTWACEPAALSFPDVNGDGAVDLAVIFSCMTGVGPTGAQEFPTGEVLVSRDGKFVTDARIDRAVEAASPKTVKDLVGVARRAAGGKKPRAGR